MTDKYGYEDVESMLEQLESRHFGPDTASRSPQRRPEPQRPQRSEPPRRAYRQEALDTQRYEEDRQDRYQLETPQGGANNVQVEALMGLVKTLTGQIEEMREENRQLRDLLSQLGRGGGSGGGAAYHAAPPVGGPAEPIIADDPWAPRHVPMESPFGPGELAESGTAPGEGPRITQVRPAPQAAQHLNNLLESNFQSTEGIAPNDPSLAAAWETLNLLGVPNNGTNEIRPGRAVRNPYRR